MFLEHIQVKYITIREWNYTVLFLTLLMKYKYINRNEYEDDVQTQ